MGATWRLRDARVSKASRLVRALGRLTPDEIADLLYALDCEGHKGDEASCPVARFVNMETGAASARVPPTHVLLYRRKITLPPTVAEFVVRFDNGEWPMLQRPRRQRRA